MSADKYLMGKNVLVMGLGFISAGATIKWLCDHGAHVTVTDLWPRGTPEKAIDALGSYKERVHFVIGEYRDKDFDLCDILVVNPSISAEDEHVVRAIKRGIDVHNELSLFMSFCPSQVIAVTGTRGKTTTATWTYHFVSSAFPGAVLAGNMGDTPLLSILDTLTPQTPVMAEVSSFQLELITASGKAPTVSVITNLMRDHLNRYETMERYADAKAHIFEMQNENDVLLLKKSDVWTTYFLDKKPKGRVIYFDEEEVGFKIEKFEQMWGAHNVDNVKAAAHAAHALGVGWDDIEKRISSLNTPPFRQEVIFQKNGLSVVNDTTATTPDGTIAALERFSKTGEIVLISGGTDKELRFDKWAKKVQSHVKPSNLFLLEGSATKKMLNALEGDYVNVRSLRSLKECVEQALKRADEIEGKTVVLFSPGAASFEKFQNEFDRGRQFNNLISEKFN